MEPRPSGTAAKPTTTDVRTTRRGVLASLTADCCEVLLLGVAASVTGSVAVRSQVAAAAADVAVQVFLLIGMLSSARPSDQAHPLGYGRERFFWSFLAALGIFIGGGGFALESAIRSALYPPVLDHFTIAYAVLAVTVVLGRWPWRSNCDRYAGRQTGGASRYEFCFVAARTPQRPRSCSAAAPA